METFTRHRFAETVQPIPARLSTRCPNPTYESLHTRKVKQDRLIAEGKLTRQPMIIGFSAEGQAAFDRGITLDDILGGYVGNA